VSLLELGAHAFVVALEIGARLPVRREQRALAGRFGSVAKAAEGVGAQALGVDCERARQQGPDRRGTA